MTRFLLIALVCLGAMACTNGTPVGPEDIKSDCEKLLPADSVVVILPGEWEVKVTCITIGW